MCDTQRCPRWCATLWMAIIPLFAFILLSLCLICWFYLHVFTYFVIIFYLCLFFILFYLILAVAPNFALSPPQMNRGNCLSHMRGFDLDAMAVMGVPPSCSLPWRACYLTWSVFSVNSSHLVQDHICVWTQPTSPQLRAEWVDSPCPCQLRPLQPQHLQRRRPTRPQCDVHVLPIISHHDRQVCAVPSAGLILAARSLTHWLLMAAIRLHVIGWHEH